MVVVVVVVVGYVSVAEEAGVEASVWEVVEVSA